jgi:hypothetical protein
MHRSKATASSGFTPERRARDRGEDRPRRTSRDHNESVDRIAIPSHRSLALGSITCAYLITKAFCNTPFRICSSRHGCQVDVSLLRGAILLVLLGIY